MPNEYWDGIEWKRPSMLQLIHGDALEILKVMPRVKCIFADPPDNIGLKYTDYTDKLPLAQYYHWLDLIIHWSLKKSDLFWLSYYPEHDLEIKHMVRDILKYEHPAWEFRQILWRFTFGQYNPVDCGYGFRPIIRLSSPSANFQIEEIRVKSVRQLSGDDRADPRGKVPDTVWDYSRVVGNATERREWHPTQHNQGLMERIVAMSCSREETFVDLFEGSGTSARACRQVHRPHIGFEISQTYIVHLEAEFGIKAKRFGGIWPYSS